MTILWKERMEHKRKKLKIVSILIWSSSNILLIAQIVLIFILYNKEGLCWLRYMGWVVWASTWVFGWLPIYTFKKYGGGRSGKSYVHTTKLVTQGIYSIVRHPQYLGFMLISLAMMLIGQHWILVTLGVPAIVLCYFIAKEGDHLGIEQFGEDYRRYMKTVPMLNPVLGLIRALK